MRPNINFFGLCLVISIKFIIFVPQIRTLRAMMLIALRRSHLKECRLVEGKHKKSVIGAWFSDIVKLRTLHYLSRDHAMVMLMGMLYTYLS